MVNIFTGRFQDPLPEKTKSNLSGLETNYSSFALSKKFHPKHSILSSTSVGSILFFFIAVILLFPAISAFGQNSTENVQNGTTNNTNSSANTNGSNTQQPIKSASTGSQLPVTTKISEKGIYKVQLTFITTLPIQSPNLLPKSGFQTQIEFLNASAAAPTSNTIPQKESAIRGESSLGMPASQPNIIKRLVPVDSFDMAIYSNDGKVLWNKTNQAVTAGTATETVSFNGNYTGPITILINNIKSSNIMTGTVTTPLSTPTPPNTTTSSTGGNGTTTDSVRFNSKLTE